MTDRRRQPSSPEHEVDPTSSPSAPVIDPRRLWSRKISVTDEVDRGGMAYIFRGTDTKLRRELALKVSPAPRDQLPREQLARFIEEAQITAQLEHPNVVPVHELGLDPDERVYFSMKLVGGRSLEDILDARKAGDADTLAEFGLRRLLDIFLQVCQAIEYAHARGVIHRDLKPGNIMVGGFGEVLVMDWGVAKLVGREERDLTDAVTIAPDDAEEAGPRSMHDSVSSIRSDKDKYATQLGTVIGTPSYMSPEQAKGVPVDERTDLYALGAILYEMLCGEPPFDGDNPQTVVVKVLTEQPRRPSEIAPSTPLALEALVMQLLEKEPEQRRLSIPQIRTHVQNYIEGIERDFGRESLWRNALWFVGALGLFAFLVWYVTGQSIAALFVLAPAPVFNALGWLLFVVALAYPLRSTIVAFQRGQAERGRFDPASGADLYVAGFLRHRTFAATIAPLSQLVFMVELVSLALTPVTMGRSLSPELLGRIMAELRAEWGRALILLLIFLFTYVFLLYREVRFARRIDRYETLVDRSGWEAIWPVLLIGVLLLTIGLTEAFDWVFVMGVRPLPYLRHAILAQPVDVFDMAKTFVFQGTFLLGLVLATVLVAFPPAEAIAALRLPYQPSDQAAVRGRAQYFLRSLAVLRLARVNWLYGGAILGSLTALTILSGQVSMPLVQQVLYVLGPSLIGFVGYSWTRGRVRSLLRTSPAIEQMLRERRRAATVERARARIEHLGGIAWRRRLFDLLVPVACIAGFLFFTGSGLGRGAIERLVVPVTTDEWLLILPYALLAPLVLVGDWVQLFWLQRIVAKADAAVTASAGGGGEGARDEVDSVHEP